MKKRYAIPVALLTAGFTAGWEGFEPIARHERIDPPNVITYCYGRTNYDEAGLRPGDVCTKEQGKQFLADDLAGKYLPPLQRCIPNFDGMPIQRQMAFLDAAYNLGSGGVCKSSMVRKLKSGDIRGACDAFLLYDRANGKVIRGLALRRQAERKLCLQDS